MASKSTGTRQVRPPDGRIRPSQTLTTYGPGAMVDLLHDAVLVGGLEFWSWGSRPREEMDEPRLRARLKKQFPHLRDIGPFVLSPVGDDRKATPGCGIQVLEFPRSVVCQRLDCRRVIPITHNTQTRSGRYVHDCGGYLSPVRFVTACVRGHIDEFPWNFFVHMGAEEDGKGICAAPDIKLRESATGDFAELIVACDSCGRTKPMIAAKGEGMLGPCSAQQPWLQRRDPDGCDAFRRLLLRTASNSYFAEVVSSLDIPEPESVHYVLEKHWADLAEMDAVADLEYARRKIPRLRDALAPFSNEDVLKARAARLAGESTIASEGTRTTEFNLFVQAEAEQPGDYPSEERRFYARSLESSALPGVARVVLAHRLREMRVQTGFTRFEARAQDLQGEYPVVEDLGLKSAPLTSHVTWLPGVVVQGEGFFLQLDEKAVEGWLRKPEVAARVEELRDGHKRWTDALKRHEREAPPFPGGRLYLLHSLAHLIIQAVSLECGYSASAIRERIYCSRPNDPIPMAAILFSTGTTGSEGTLGGLLEQGRALREHLRRAWDYGTLCSNDPVCANHAPAKDPTERFLQGAACHGCLFIAEPSCEHFNRFLDRALVFPTLGHEKVAFFRERP